MTEALSDRLLTPFNRYVFPAVLLASFLVVATLMLVGQWNWDAPALQGTILGLGYFFGAAHYFSVARRLRRVIATDDGLLVSNHRREVLVPWSNVARMRGNRWSRHGRITVELRSPTMLGKRIIFIPYLKRGLPIWREHPAARIIRERAGLAE